jgi:Carboxypeptidase regulatory-like domain/Domain of unknown function (DUF4332)
MSELSFLLSSPEIIQGIGPERARLLKDAAIGAIADMFAARAPRVHKLLGDVSAREVGNWFCAATLLRVEGMTPAIAAVLVDAGLRSVSKVAEAGLQTLERAIKAGVDAGHVPSLPSLYKLADLQQEAWRARDRGMVAGQVQDNARAPIAGAKVKLGPYSTTTDDGGRYAFDGVPEGKFSTVITGAGRPGPLSVAPLTVIAGKLTGPVTHRIPPATPTTFSPPTVDEFDGELIVNTARTSTQLDSLELDKFRDGAYFLTREIRSDGRAQLLSFYKRRIGTTIHIDRVLVAPADLPANTKVGDVLLLSSGHLQQTSLTPSDVAQLKREKWEQTHPATQRRVIKI